MRSPNSSCKTSKSVIKSEDADRRKNTSGSGSNQSPCGHVNKGCKLRAVEKSLPHKKLGMCEICRKEPPGNSSLEVCLNCTELLCDSQHCNHALHHAESAKAHQVFLNLGNHTVNCKSCGIDIPKDLVPELKSVLSILEKMTAKKSQGVKDEKSALKSPVKGKSDIRTDFPVKGIRNIGNTCFFNSVLQCLASFDVIYQVLEGIAAGSDTIRLESTDRSMDPVRLDLSQHPAGPVTEAFYTFLSDLKNSSCKNMDPKPLFTAISTRHSQFKSFDQQDAQELLSCLVDDLKTEEIERVRACLKGVLCAGGGSSIISQDVLKGYLACYQSEVDQFFYGSTSTIVICQDCQNESRTTNVCLSLTIPITSLAEAGTVVVPRQADKAVGSVASPSAPTVSAHTPVPEKSLSKHQRKQLAKNMRKKKPGRKRAAAMSSADKDPKSDCGADDSQLAESNVSALDGSGSAADDGDPSAEGSNISADGSDLSLTTLEVGRHSSDLSLVGSFSESGASRFDQPSVELDHRSVHYRSHQCGELGHASVFSQSPLIDSSESLGITSNRVAFGSSDLSVHVVIGGQRALDDATGLSARLSDDDSGRSTSESRTSSQSSRCDLVQPSGVETCSHSLAELRDPHVTARPWTGALPESRDRYLVEQSNVDVNTLEEALAGLKLDDTTTRQVDIPALGMKDSLPEVNKDEGFIEGHDPLVPSLLLPSVLSSTSAPVINETRRTLLAGLIQHYSPELVDGYKCERCCKGSGNRSSSAHKSTLLMVLPPILTLQVCRFELVRNHLRKVADHVAFPMDLDMGPFCKEPALTSSKYQLVGVVVHYGSLTNGHYTAVVRRDSAASGGGEPEWFEVSDDHVRSVKLSAVEDASAYLLFYKRLDAAESRC